MQVFNRYSYVNNNPMRYTDPSGYMSQGCGHNPYWAPTAQSIANQQGNWNDQFGWNIKKWLEDKGGMGGGMSLLDAFAAFNSGTLSLSEFGLANTPLDVATVALLNNALMGTGLEITTNNGVQGFWVSYGVGNIGKPTRGSDGVWNLSVFTSGMKFVAFVDGGNFPTTAELEKDFAPSFKEAVINNYVNNANYTPVNPQTLANDLLHSGDLFSDKYSFSLRAIEIRIALIQGNEVISNEIYKRDPYDFSNLPTVIDPGYNRPIVINNNNIMFMFVMNYQIVIPF